MSSLYDRLGGIYNIALVVNHFSDALLKNPIVGVDSKNTYLRDWNRKQAPTRLAGLKFMRTLWLAEVSGGPYQYVATREGQCPLSLENAHGQLRISPAEFDAVAKELANTLKHFKIPKSDADAVLEAFANHKGDVNYGYFVANGMRPGRPSC